MARHGMRLTSITRATGQGTKKDEAKAAYWYFQAAEGGFLRAQVAIGSLLWRGRGTAQNMDEALKWCAHSPVPAFVRILWACVLLTTTMMCAGSRKLRRARTWRG